MIDIVCGGQAGDEGKGKISAYLSYKGNYDYCVRVGGPNAGHTVVKDGKSYTLKNIPSGFLNPKTKLVLGAGAYTKTEWLLDEVNFTGTKDRLIIDPYAVLITDEQTAAEKNAEHFMKHIGSVGTGLGQAVRDRIERRNIKFAKDESSNGDILIEKYMKGAHEFQVTYFFIEGEAYLIRTVDSYCGLEEDKMEKVVACAVSPSKYTELYLTNAHENVVKMFKSMGFKNGPIFMQGFEDHGRFRFFDPGLRFPGVDYENIYKSVFNIDIMEAMVNFAMNGNCANIRLPKNGFLLNGKRAAVLFPTLSAGNIKSISGFEEVSCDQSVVSILPRCVEGEKIAWTYNVNQRMAEVDLLSENTVELKHKIDEIQHKLIVLDTNGANMNYRYFDVERIDN